MALSKQEEGLKALENAKDIQKCAPYTIWVYRVQRRVNKGRVQCARA